MADGNDVVMSSAPPAVPEATNQVAVVSDIAVIANGEEAPKSTQEPVSADVIMRKEEENDLLETKIPTKKDATLREFLSKMDDHAPIIPDAVVNYYLTLAGLPPPPATPLPLARLLALATQKFIADVAADAYQYSRIRSNNTSAANPNTGMPGMPAAVPGLPGLDKAEKGDKGKSSNLGVQRSGFGSGGTGGAPGRTVLTMEDLGMAIGEYGVNVRRGEFYR